MFLFGKIYYAKEKHYRIHTALSEIGNCVKVKEKKGTLVNEMGKKTKGKGKVKKLLFHLVYLDFFLFPRKIR